jgi:hypothetical protein
VSGGDDLTATQLGAIRRVVKEEIEEHYSGLARKALGWVVGGIAGLVAGAYVLGSWVTALNSRIDVAERVFVNDIKTIKESLVEIKEDLKDKDNK